MKNAVNAVIVYGISDKKASKEYVVPLETLRRKVAIARNGGGVEKKDREANSSKRASRV